MNNTPYSDEELEHFKELLLKEQQETTGEVNELKEVIGDVDSNRDDVSSSQDHHPGDLGTEEESKETNYTLIDRQLDKLEEINAALDRISNKSYGVCEDTGKKIQKDRLEAIPYTRYSVGAKEKYDDANSGPIGKPRA
ncbi:MAG: TraR/DksA C4-type zinc finger protein [Balneolaceae bacterium]